MFVVHDQVIRTLLRRRDEHLITAFTDAVERIKRIEYLSGVADNKKNLVHAWSLPVQWRRFDGSGIMACVRAGEGQSSHRRSGWLTSTRTSTSGRRTPSTTRWRLATRK